MVGENESLVLSVGAIALQMKPDGGPEPGRAFETGEAIPEHNGSEKTDPREGSMSV